MQKIETEVCLIVDNEVYRNVWVKIKKTDGSTVIGVLDGCDGFNNETDSDYIELVTKSNTRIALDIDDIKSIKKLADL